MVEILIIVLVVGIFMALVIGVWLGGKIGLMRANRKWEGEIPGLRKDAILRSRAVLSGQFSEQLAPYLPDFKFKPGECKFIGKPIDLIVFRGMDDREVDEIVFVEVKSGNSKLTSFEKKVKEAVESGKVRWEEYKVPEGLTKKSDIF